MDWLSPKGFQFKRRGTGGRQSPRHMPSALLINGSIRYTVPPIKFINVFLIPTGMTPGGRRWMAGKHTCTDALLSTA